MLKLFQRMDTNGTITSFEFTDHIGSKKKIRLVLNHHEIAKFNDESSANELMSVLESLGFNEIVFPTLSYYDFGDLILCERCADEYVEDCRRYWDEEDDAAEYARFNGGR